MTGRRVLATGLAVAATVACGCSVQPESSPRDLPDDEQILPINEGGGAVAVGGDYIYLVGPGDERLLRAVPRAAASPRDLIELLLAGPNDAERDDQYTTNIPLGTEVVSARKQGQFLTINLTEDITELTPQSLIDAIAQIVLTAAEIDDVETVRIEVDDETRLWPTGSGDPKSDLRIYDYPNVVQTKQPPYPATPTESG